MLGLGNKDLNIDRREDCLKIDIPWFQGTNLLYGIGTSIASIVLIGIGIVMVIHELFEGDWDLRIVGCIASLVFILGFLFGYMGLGLLFNKIKIRVNRQELIVRHEPIPSPATKKSLAISDIGQWSIDHKRQRDGYGNVTITYQLLVHDKSTGRNVTLIKGRRSSREVSQIQIEIQDFIRSLNNQ
jgi:hypothetical protein